MVKANLFSMWLTRKWVLFQWWLVNKVLTDVCRKQAEERESYKWNLNRLNVDLDMVKARNRHLQQTNNGLVAENTAVFKQIQKITLKNLTDVLDHPRFLNRIKDESAEWMMAKMGADMKKCTFEEEEIAYIFHQLAYTLVENLRTHVRTVVEKRPRFVPDEQPVVMQIRVEPYQVAYCATPYTLSALGSRAANNF